MAEFDKDTNVRSNEYINKAELIWLMEETKEDKLTREVIECHPTIEIPEAPHFETEAEGIAYLVGAFSVALDIVYCKYCKHRRGGNCFKEEPKGFNHKKDTDYCSKGERRTEW